MTRAILLPQAAKTEIIMPFQQIHMPFKHRDIPVLPLRPRTHPISDHLARSYSAGRQNFSRACQGKPIELTLTTQDAFAETVQARLVTTLNSAEGTAQAQIPFTRTDPQTLTCRIIPERLGLQSYRAEFSLDGRNTWLRDTIPDAWVLIDPPQVDGLRLYTLIPSASGTIADWKADLKRIQTMGFNAVHLLPVTAQDASGSPYAAAELFSVDPRYLSTASQMDGLSQLDEYVEEAKLLEMRLCFDLVLNHVGAGSAMARQAPDWIVPDQHQPDGFGRARYWSENAWHTWDDLVLINYEHPSESIRSEIWTYMTDYALFWSAYADYTGGFLRFDNLHSSNPDFIETLTTTLHSKYPQVGLLAEYFTDDHTLLNTAPAWGLNLLLATPWNYKFVPQLREYLKYIHRVSGQVRYFMPITSQDSGSPAQEFGTADSTIPRYVAAALLGTGATGMPQGVEFGESERIDFIGTRARMLSPAEPRFASFIGRVNAILAAHSAFRCGGNCRFVDDGHPAIIAAFRQDPKGPGSGFLVVCNFDTGTPQCFLVDLAPFLGEDTPLSCCELLSGEMRSYPSPKLELLLAPCTAQVLEFI